MAYTRELRKEGERLLLGGTEYQIVDVTGCGGSSVVYRAVYQDALNIDQLHQVLIKELYPFTPRGEVYRDENGWIRWIPDAEELVLVSRMRFKQGNQVNLKLLQRLPSQMSGNLNSYEAYGTYYSVLTVHGGQNLQDVLESGKRRTLRETAQIMEKILDALECFHENRLLHLDISPDNILLLPEQAMLIDYNSAWSLDDEQNEEFVFSEKDGYSAPEIRMRESRQIGYATDLYSVCAVFFHMLTGRKLTDSEIIGNRLKQSICADLEIFENEPKSAVYKAIQIILRGLHMLARKRYQSVNELRADMDELLNRIEGKGVSHSAIWESSRTLYKKTGKADTPYLRQEIGLSKAGDVSLEELYTELRNGGNFLLKGPGGMGKTRLLKELWRMGTKGYQHTSPVVYYISLKEYQETQQEAFYIRNHFVQNLCFSKKQSTAEDAAHELERIFDRSIGNSVSVILLLDGLNEAGSSREKLLKEIESLSQREGVSILVTERSDEVLKYALGSFQSAQMLPLKEEIVEEELEKQGILMPSEPRLRELLSNPMMLGLYREVCSTEDAYTEKEKKQQAEAITSMEMLVMSYLKSLQMHQMRVHTGDQAAQLRDQYILEHLLVDIAGEMKKQKSTLLTFDELYAVVKQNYNTLQEKEFGKCFPEYLGKARLIFAGIANEAEWFDFAIVERLIGELGLLVKSENGYGKKRYYGLIHDNFLDYLMKQADIKFALYEKKRRLKRFLKADLAVLSAILVLLAGGVTVYYGKAAAAGTEKQVYSEEEQKTIDRAIVCLQQNLGTLSSQIMAQRDILEMAEKTGVLKNNSTDTESLSWWIENKKTLTESLTVLSLKAELIEELVAINPEFPIEHLQALSERPVEMGSIMNQALQRLDEMLCDPDSVYTDEQVRQEIVEVYQKYLDLYVQYTFFEFDYVVMSMDPKNVGKILDDNRYTQIFWDYFNATSVGEQDLERVKAAMNSALENLKSAQREMGSSNYKIDWDT